MTDVNALVEKLSELVEWEYTFIDNKHILHIRTSNTGKFKVFIRKESFYDCVCAALDILNVENV